MSGPTQAPSRTPAEDRVCAEVRAVQERDFSALVRRMLPTNAFYRARYEPLGFTCGRPLGLSDLERLPLISRRELVADQKENPPYGRNLSCSPARYTRLHRSERPGQKPLRWLDTAESWEWCLGCWVDIYQATGVVSDDRIVVTSSHDLDLGSGAALEGGQKQGALVILAGGMRPEHQLSLAGDHEATILVCRSRDAQRLADATRRDGAPAMSSLRTIMMIENFPRTDPEHSARLEAALDAPVIRVAAAAEIGTWGHGCSAPGVLHVNETRFIAEVIDPATGAVVASNEGVRRGELVLTNLGRVGSPLIRFRTGLRVAFSRTPCACGRDASVLLQPRSKRR